MRLPKIDRILSADSQLQPLLAKTREIRALAGLVDGFLPPDLARQIRVANFRDGELALLAANSAVAAKLKLLAPSLSRYLLEQRRQVNSVSVRVQPNTSHSQVPVATRKSAHLSTRTLDRLRELHETMKNSPAREALRALLEHNAALRPGPAGAPPAEEEGSEEQGKRRT